MVRIAVLVVLVVAVGFVPVAQSAKVKRDGSSCKGGHALLRHQTAGTGNGDYRNIVVRVIFGHNDGERTKVTWKWKLRNHTVVCKVMFTSDYNYLHPDDRRIKSGRTSGSYTEVVYNAEGPLLSIYARYAR